jgi:hypothetical protein
VNRLLSAWVLHPPCSLSRPNLNGNTVQERTWEKVRHVQASGDSAIRFGDRGSPGLRSVPRWRCCAAERAAHCVCLAVRRVHRLEDGPDCSPHQASPRMSERGAIRKVRSSEGGDFVTPLPLFVRCSGRQKRGCVPCNLPSSHCKLHDSSVLACEVEMSFFPQVKAGTEGCRT